MHCVSFFFVSVLPTAFLSINSFKLLSGHAGMLGNKESDFFSRRNGRWDSTRGILLSIPFCRLKLTIMFRQQRTKPATLLLRLKSAKKRNRAKRKWCQSWAVHEGEEIMPTEGKNPRNAAKKRRENLAKRNGKMWSITRGQARTLKSRMLYSWKYAQGL